MGRHEGTKLFLGREKLPLFAAAATRDGRNLGKYLVQDRPTPTGSACPDPETQAGTVVRDLADEILASSKKKSPFFVQGDNLSLDNWSPSNPHPRKREQRTMKVNRPWKLNFIKYENLFEGRTTEQSNIRLFVIRTF